MKDFYTEQEHNGLAAAARRIDKLCESTMACLQVDIEGRIDAAVAFDEKFKIVDAFSAITEALKKEIEKPFYTLEYVPRADKNYIVLNYEKVDDIFFMDTDCKSIAIGFVYGEPDGEGSEGVKEFAENKIFEFLSAETNEDRKAFIANNMTQEFVF